MGERVHTKSQLEIEQTSHKTNKIIHEYSNEGESGSHEGSKKLKLKGI